MKHSIIEKIQKELVDHFHESCTSSKAVFILESGYYGTPIGVFSSLEEMSKGVDYTINDWTLSRWSPKLLYYHEYQLDYPIEPMGWEWVYIPKSSSLEKLKKGGGSIPNQKFWGKNLLAIDWSKTPLA